MTLGRSTAVWLAAVMITLTAPAVATATPTWLAPVTVSNPADNAYGSPQVAVNAQGDATAVWERQNVVVGVLQSGARPPGGSWAAPGDVSAPGFTVSKPQVVEDAQGNATAAWEQGGKVKAATRTLGGAWTATPDLSGPNPGDSGFYPQLAIDGQGTVTAVWAQDFAGPRVVRSAVLTPGGTWSAPVTLSGAPSFNLSDPQVAVNAQGDATAVWLQIASGTRTVKSAARTGGTWSAPVALDTGGQNASVPQVAVDPQGNATAVWYRDGATNIVQGAARTAGTWSATTDLSAAGEYGDAPQVAVDPQGNATAVWTLGAGGSPQKVQSATHAAGGAWSAPVDVSAPISDPFPEVNPQVAVDVQGNATAVWTGYNGTNQLVQSANRPAAGAWTTPVEISTSGQRSHRAQLAVDGAGDVTAVWSADGTSTTLVKSAVLDVAGPVLGSVQIPASGLVGQSLAFSVVPTDQWSALGATTWDFGDGGTATGTSVTHAYAAPGTYTVTLTSADVLGNTTTLTRQVVITAAPPPPPVQPLTLTDVSANPLCIGTGSGAGSDVKISYTLSDAAQVTYTLQRRTSPGLTTPRSCPGALPVGTNSVEYTDVGSPTSISSGAGAGYATVQQSGAITRRATTARRHALVRTVSKAAGRTRVSLLRTLRATGPLTPGRYRVLIQAVRADGSRSQQATVRFWVLRPPKR